MRKVLNLLIIFAFALLLSCEGQDDIAATRESFRQAARTLIRIVRIHRDNFNYNRLIAGRKENAVDSLQKLTEPFYQNFLTSSPVAPVDIDAYNDLCSMFRKLLGKSFRPLKLNEPGETDSALFAFRITCHVARMEIITLEQYTERSGVIYDDFNPNALVTRVEPNLGEDARIFFSKRLDVCKLDTVIISKVERNGKAIPYRPNVILKETAVPVIFNTLPPGKLRVRGYLDYYTPAGRNANGFEHTLLRE